MTSREIREQIEQTRSHIDATIDDLQARLSPNHLMRQARDYVTDARRETSEMTMNMIKKYPVPSTLIGIGAGWLLTATAKDKGQTARHRWEDDRIRARDDLYEAGLESEGTAYERPLEPSRFTREGRRREDPHLRARADLYEAGMETQGTAYEGGEPRTASKEAAERAGREAREKAQRARARASQWGEDARQRAEVWGRRAYRRANDWGERGRRRASAMGSRAQSSAEHTRDNFWQTVDEHPLTMGAAMFATGMAAALILPATRREDQWMGGRRDQLWREAKERGEQMYEKGEAVAQQTLHAAADEAERQGLKPEQVKEEAKTQGRSVQEQARAEAQDIQNRVEKVAESGREAAQEEAQRQNLTGSFEEGENESGNASGS